jgi:CRP-like cAMP-binding protein
MDSAKVKLLMSMFTYVPLSEGSFIFKEGDLNRADGNSLYLLYDGHVEVMAKGDKDKESVLATLDPGTFFGEVGLV